LRVKVQINFQYKLKVIPQPVETQEKLQLILQTVQEERNYKFYLKFAFIFK